MARCPSCNKFSSLTFEDPETQDISVEVDEDEAKEWKPGDESFVHVNAEITVDRNSECCGDKVKTGTYSFDENVESHDLLQTVKDHLAKDGDHSFSIEVVDASVDESGGGRYEKNMLRLNATYEISCCGGSLGEGEIESELAASEYEEAC